MWFTALLSLLLLNPAPPATFTNPVSPRGEDPWVVMADGRYYHCFSDGGAVLVRSSDSLLNLFEAEAEMVWHPEPNKPWSKALWAPELHRVEGGWHIYVAAADRWPGGDHRMQLLSREDADPVGPFQHEGTIQLPEDKWAIDGTPLEIEGEHFFVWSGWPGDENRVQNLYIARMQSPTQAAGERTLISTPTHDWEQVGVPWVNEGPQVLKHGGRTFIIFSASGSWTDDYCLGVLELVGADPMDAQSWKKCPEPIFAGTDDAVSPGHPSFTTSPDGTEHWIVYHTARHRGAGWNRNIRMQPFTFSEDGFPIFGQPVPPGQAIPIPSGDRIKPEADEAGDEARQRRRERQRNRRKRKNRSPSPAVEDGDQVSLGVVWPMPYLSISSA